LIHFYKRHSNGLTRPCLHQSLRKRKLFGTIMTAEQMSVSGQKVPAAGSSVMNVEDGESGSCSYLSFK